MSNTGEIDEPRRRTKENENFDEVAKFMFRDSVRKMTPLGQARPHKSVIYVNVFFSDFQERFWFEMEPVYKLLRN